MAATFKMPPWVRSLLRSKEYARVKNEADKARAEVSMSPMHAAEWRIIADALDRRALELKEEP